MIIMNLKVIFYFKKRNEFIVNTKKKNKDKMGQTSNNLKNDINIQQNQLTIRFFFDQPSFFE